MGNKQPTHVIKVGSIRVAIWATEGADCETQFMSVVTRLDKTGNEWRETTTLRHDDLLAAITAFDLAYSWIWRKQARQRPAETTVTDDSSASPGR